MSFEFSVDLHMLRFKKPAKTSRNVFTEKPHWVLRIFDTHPGVRCGIGEAAPLFGLSPDYNLDLGKILTQKMKDLKSGTPLGDIDFTGLPSVRFAMESALLDYHNGGHGIYFRSSFLKGKPIPINGLVWMDTPEAMLEEALGKIRQGYRCIKLKVGSVDFDSECSILGQIRKKHGYGDLQIRLDANGAFAADEALNKLDALSRFKIHSIEQPVKTNQWEAMANICRESKVPVALDEELIGRAVETEGDSLIKKIMPQYLILKPGLLGGFTVCDAWVKLAEKYKIGWWSTSALESNIGLSAIAQWAGQYQPEIYQGLGTGLLYENNFPTGLSLEAGALYYKSEGVDGQG